MIGLSNLNSEVFTIINQIPTSQTVATKSAWVKHTLTMCGKKDGLYDKTSGAMVFKANTWTAFIYNWEQYKKPLWTDGGYYALADEKKGGHFTVNVGDLLIFAEIPDAVPKTLQEFNALRDKYKDNGGIITGSEVYINYKPNGAPWSTNHIEIIKG
ncbi:hypothetical protein [Congzhengia minquanensis]|uniref:Uncharacterized protein n=1 Tax=Congzhengia minquanensis TaxID=2763657 RepID=A0A926HYZ2_9FIRM|nr:hypothetical protein [Congzhengia minquanensis]MBC8540635.1 hypothetical protein [Congzhengia minquanensis]